MSPAGMALHHRCDGSAGISLPHFLEHGLFSSVTLVFPVLCRVFPVGCSLPKRKIQRASHPWSAATELSGPPQSGDLSGPPAGADGDLPASGTAGGAVIGTNKKGARCVMVNTNKEVSVTD